MSECKTCKYNSYRELALASDWVSCGHPTTLSKAPRWEKGDPAAVDAMTGDWNEAEASLWAPCPTFEPVTE
jgi:hypothetical protein